MGFKAGVSVQDVPDMWYNINADLPMDMPAMLKNETANALSDEGTYPKEIIRTLISKERYIPIPEEIRNLYAMWRPSPLIRATNLEKYLDTPAKIYLKYEGASFTGSHKLNGAIPQAYYAAQEGFSAICTPTGGQWGTAFAFACQHFGYEPIIFLMRQSNEHRPMRKTFMEMFGAQVVLSPSNKTEFGRRLLRDDPNHPGSLGIATSETREYVACNPGAMHSRGELLHQTVVGLEVKKQLAAEGDYPDIVIGCLGFGSNFGGITFPFFHDVFVEGKKIEIIGVEPKGAPVFTEGVYRYDYADTKMTTPQIKMYTLGCEYLPPPIHAGGLRIGSRNPILSALYHAGHFKAEVCSETESLSAGLLLAKLEGIVPATESAYAVKGAIDKALECKALGKQKTILVNISGNGLFDLNAYQDLVSGKMKDCKY